MKQFLYNVMVLSVWVICGCGSTPSGGGMRDNEPERAQPEDGGDQALDDTTPPDEIMGDDDSLPSGGSTCPSTQATFAEMIPASYAIVLRYLRGPGDLVDFTLGSAFAVRPRTLATNAHVAAAIIENAFPVDEVVAVQAGTGRVVKLTSTTIHPGYTGNPVASPDVAIFTTREELPVHLELASAAEADLTVGDTLAMTGFPGDVNELFQITPGSTVPQATSLSGSITAIRSFDPGAIVTVETADFVQHQLPTTPGTSGSPLVHCGKVVAVHNAGTVNLIITVDSDGNLSADRQSAAANNFGITVKHLTELLNRVDDGLLTPEPLPPPDPSFAGRYACEAEVSLTGIVTHRFTLRIDGDRSVSGTSFWQNVVLTLSGTIDRFGELRFSDNGVSQGFVAIVYVGYGSAQTGNIIGAYFEQDTKAGLWVCARE